MSLPGRNSNSLFTNSFFIFAVRFFPSLANLLVMIWYSRHLSETQYGNYQHFWIHLLIIYPVICFGIHVLLITYSRSFILSLLRRIKTKYYVLYFIWAISWSALFGWLQWSSLSLTFVVPFLFIFFYALSFIFESYLIVSGVYKNLTVISVLYSIIFCGIHWCVLADGFSLQSLFLYLLLLTAVRFGVYCGIAIVNIRNYRETQTRKEAPLGHISSLWLHLGLYDISQVLFSYIDKFIISILLTASVTAVYFNGSQNIPFLPLLLSAAGSAVLMQLAAGKQQDEAADTIRLMNQTGRVLSCIVFPLFFFLLFFRTELVVWLLTDKYIPAIPVFFVSILVLPVRAYSYTTVLQRMHKGRIINAGALADLLLACGLMYPLYKWLGLPGVALSFVISTYLQAAFYLFYSARLLHTTPLKLIPYANWLLKLLIFAALFITVRCAGNLFFSGKITLILGMIMMVVLSGVSLIMELKKQKVNVSIS